MPLCLCGQKKKNGVVKKILKNISPGENIFLPNSEVFAYPEKVLQFGTGVLLRGLPDFVINRANNKGNFKGRIVIVKSTSGGGDADTYNKQDGLYTVCVRGTANGQKKMKCIFQLL